MEVVKEIEGCLMGGDKNHHFPKCIPPPPVNNDGPLNTIQTFSRAVDIH